MLDLRTAQCHVTYISPNVDRIYRLSILRNGTVALSTLRVKSHTSHEKTGTSQMEILEASEDTDHCCWHFLKVLSCFGRLYLSPQTMVGYSLCDKENTRRGWPPVTHYYTHYNRRAT